MLCIFKRRDNEGQGLQQAKAEGGGIFLRLLEKP